MAATPHIRDDHPFPFALKAQRRQELKGALREAGLQLEIVNGGEVAVSKVTQLDDETLAGLCLGRGPYILVESPYTQAPSLLESVFVATRSGDDAAAADRAGSVVREQIASMVEAAQGSAAEIERKARESGDASKREALGGADAARPRGLPPFLVDGVMRRGKA